MTGGGEADAAGGAGDHRDAAGGQGGMMIHRAIPLVIGARL
jgi:hypothetical protein